MDARWCIFFILLIVSFVNGRKHIESIEIVSQSLVKCPHMKSAADIINFDATKFHHRESPNSEKLRSITNLTSLRILDIDRKSNTIKFPGCYDFAVNAKFERGVANPYIEAYMNIGGQHQPCDSFKSNPYCPGTGNNGLRNLTKHQKLCRFCDLCLTSEEIYNENKKSNPEARVALNQKMVCPNRGQKFLANTSYIVRLSNICTPTKEKLEEDFEKKLGPQWMQHEDLVSRGTLLLTLHVMDRLVPTPKPCLELGAGTFKWKGPAGLLQSIRQRLTDKCKPYLRERVLPHHDKYIGCYFGYINYKLNFTGT